jgi:predicted dehydrogenase
MMLLALRRSPPTSYWDKMVKVGLIGCGYWGKNLVRNFHQLDALAAIHDSDRQTAASMSATFGTPVLDLDAILARSDIPAVVIAVPAAGHGVLVRRALEAGKHVFVEKPLCLREEELADVLDAYAHTVAQGLRLMVGFNRRYSPHAVQIRTLFDGRRNPLVMIYRVNAGVIDRKHWIQDVNVGGGRIIGEACHFIDFMQFVAGSLVSAVSAVSIGHQETGITDDQAIATLEFADGSIGTLAYAAGGDRALAKERFEVFGDGKAAVLDDFKSTEKFSGGRRSTFHTSKQDKGFAREMATFCDSITRGEAELPSIAEIESVTRACCFIDRSLGSRERYQVPGT